MPTAKEKLAQGSGTSAGVVRTHVSFHKYALGYRPEREIAEWLRAELRRHGVDSGAREDLEYATVFPAKVDASSFKVTVEFADDGFAQWLIYVEQRRGLLSKVLGRDDASALIKLVQLVDEILHGYEQHSHIRWYTAVEWANSRDKTFAGSPLGD